MPEKCVDPIYIASIISQKIKEMAIITPEKDDTIILGITAINGGKNNNVIPEKVYLKGICRTYNNQTRKEVKDKLTTTVEQLAREMGRKSGFRIYR